MRLKFLLRPGWIGFAVAVVVFSTLCFTVLSPWQFRRDAENQAQNDAIQSSMTTPPKPLDQVLRPGTNPGPGTEWSQVTFSGHYLPAGETLGWQRTVLGEPAFEVLTPFQLDNGTTLLVDRGYIRPIHGIQAPPYPAPPTGRVTVSARVRVDEEDRDHRPAFQRDGHLWVYAIDAATVSAGTGVAIRPGYFQLNEQQPGVLQTLPLPQLDSGPYFSYALQWIAFGVMAPLGLAYLVYRELNPIEDDPIEDDPTEDDLAAESTGKGSTPRGTPGKGSTGKRSNDREAAAGGGRRRRRMSVAEAIAEDERREREELAALTTQEREEAESQS